MPKAAGAAVDHFLSDEPFVLACAGLCAAYDLFGSSLSALALITGLVAAKGLGGAIQLGSVVPST